MSSEVQKITIGELRTGFVGLAEIFKEVQKQNLSNAKILKSIIFEKVKSQNYVPASMVEGLKIALLREYKKFLGEEIEEDKISEHEIKVLGLGCYACDKVLEETKSVLAEIGKAAYVEHVKNLKEIGRYGMLATPALIIDGKVKSSGKIPSKEKIKKWLEEA